MRTMKNLIMPIAEQLEVTESTVNVSVHDVNMCCS